MTSIFAAQNRPCNIQRLTAQRHLYSIAKRLSVLQPLLAAVTSVAGAIAAALWSDAQPWVALAGFLVPLINLGWLDPWQHDFRRRAASVQEDFDCNVLELPWNDVLGEHRPAAEDVYEVAKKAPRGTEAPLENWYPAVVDSLPLHQARIICQRTNCRWDSKVRRGYRRGILIALTVIAAFVILLGFVTEMTLQRLILGVAAPLSPTLLWGMREARRQKAAAAALERLRDFAEICWREISSGKLREAAATRRSRELQDGILVHRRTNPLVLDWIYRHRRRDYEEQMEVGAEDMVAEVMEHRQSRRTGGNRARPPGGVGSPRVRQARTT